MHDKMKKKHSDFKKQFTVVISHNSVGQEFGWLDRAQREWFVSAPEGLWLRTGDSNGWELEPVKMAWRVSLFLLGLSTWHLGLPPGMAALGKLVLHDSSRPQVLRGSDKSCKILGLLP